MVKLFDYTDFREYLKEYYNEKKSLNYRYSYQMFAEKADIKNRGFVYNVIHGGKKLSDENRVKLSVALKHTPKEAEYFAKIVAYAQAKKQDVKSMYLKQALAISAERSMYHLRRDQFEFYSGWQHSAIRSLVNSTEIRDNYADVGKKFLNPLTAAQVKKSLSLLSRLGLVERDETGCYRLTEQRIRTSDEISQAARNNFHAECAELAISAIKNEPPTSRNAVSITMGLSKAAYNAIVNETQLFINSIVDIVKSDESPKERTYQYELLLFPLTVDKEEE